jgi:MFS transporter, ACS family, glucarate transporter
VVDSSLAAERKTTAAAKDIRMRTRYVVLLLLVLLSVITYMDRICIGVLATPMQQDLGISKASWGWVISAFLVGYGLFEIPSGALGDRWGQRKVLTRIVVWWSAFTMLTGVASNYYALVATRFLFGAGEAGAYPNASGCISRWFPVTERARAQGLVWGASRVGGALTPLLIAPMLTVLPWQTPFFIFGAVGLVWAVAWAVWFRDDPAMHPAMTADELEEIGPGSVRSAHENVPWIELLRSSRLWLILAMYWFYVFGAIFFMFALTQYFTDARGMTKYEAAISVSLAFGAGAVGNAIGGWASDRLSKRFGLLVGRSFVGAACLAGTGALLLATAFTPGKLPAAVFLILAFGVMDGMLPAAWALCLDVGGHYSGAVSGAMNTAGQAAGAVCMVLYGYMIGWCGYELPLVIFSAHMFISAVLFACIDPRRPLVRDAAPDDRALVE